MFGSHNPVRGEALWSFSHNPVASLICVFTHLFKRLGHDHDSRILDIRAEALEACVRFQRVGHGNGSRVADIYFTDSERRLWRLFSALVMAMTVSALYHATDLTLTISLINRRWHGADTSGTSVSRGATGIVNCFTPGHTCSHRFSIQPFP